MSYPHWKSKMLSSRAILPDLRGASIWISSSGAYERSHTLVPYSQQEETECTQPSSKRSAFIISWEYPWQFSFVYTYDSRKWTRVEQALGPSISVEVEHQGLTGKQSLSDRTAGKRWKKFQYTTPILARGYLFWRHPVNLSPKSGPFPATSERIVQAVLPANAFFVPSFFAFRQTASVTFGFFPVSEEPTNRKRAKNNIWKC